MLETQTGRTASAEIDPADWWAVYTRHQHEKVVADMLKAKGLEVFFPVYETQRQWKDRKKMIMVPLFPCYLFVRAKVNGALPVVSTPGVHSILTRGVQFALVPENEICAIQRALQQPARVEPHPFLKCGERVRVSKGPMEGVEGILVRKKDRWRLILSVEMLSQSAAVEVDASDVEPATFSLCHPYPLCGAVSYPQIAL
jgi:transcription antitermination factor NusG